MIRFVSVFIPPYHPDTKEKTIVSDPRDTRERAYMYVPARCERSPVDEAERVEDTAIERAQAALDRARNPTPPPAPRRERRARPTFRWHGFRATTPTPDMVEEYRNRPDFETVVEIRPAPVRSNPRRARLDTQETATMANAPAPSATSTSTTSNRPKFASERLAEIETELGHLISSSKLADRLVTECILLQAERRDCDEPTYAAVKETMDWGVRIGFASRMIQVIPMAIRIAETPGMTRMGKVITAWQAILGIVVLYEAGSQEVFGLEENRIAGLLNRTPVAKDRAREDFNRARPVPTPSRPSAPDIDALLKSGGASKAEATRQEPPRGNRGGDRGHGKASKPAPQASRPAPAPAEDEDDERQPPAGAHEATSLVDAVKAEALASGDRRRR